MRTRLFCVSIALTPHYRTRRVFRIYWLLLLIGDAAAMTLISSMMFETVQPLTAARAERPRSRDDIWEFMSSSVAPAIHCSAHLSRPVAPPPKFPVSPDSALSAGRCCCQLHFSSINILTFATCRLATAVKVMRALDQQWAPANTGKMALAP